MQNNYYSYAYNIAYESIILSLHYSLILLRLDSLVRAQVLKAEMWAEGHERVIEKASDRAQDDLERIYEPVCNLALMLTSRKARGSTFPFLCRSTCVMTGAVCFRIFPTALSCSKWRAIPRDVFSSFLIPKPLSMYGKTGD